MEEITSKDNIKLYDYYVVRNDKLYSIDRNDILVGEMYCHPVNTPPNSPGALFMKGKRGEHKDPFYAFDPIEYYIYKEGYTLEKIKDFILETNEFEKTFRILAGMKEQPKERKLSPLIQHLVDKIEEKNLKITFGLEAQGHIPTIERMIEEFNAPSETNPDGEDISQSLYLWDKIAKEIGWDAKTAMAYYIRYLRTKK